MSIVEPDPFSNRACVRAVRLEDWMMDGVAPDQFDMHQSVTNSCHALHHVTSQHITLQNWNGGTIFGEKDSLSH